MSYRIGRDKVYQHPDILRRLIDMMRCGVHSADAIYASLAISNCSLHHICKVSGGAGCDQRCEFMMV